MKPNRLTIFFNEYGWLIGLAILRLLLHLVTNTQYGFHRDEWAALDEARFLDWGYVAYPPLTPFFGRIALELFGLSTVGVRLFPAIFQSIGMIITGLIARELGGSRPAQVVAVIATAIAPMSLIMGALYQYISFDYLWWLLTAFFLVKLIKSENPRWWLAIGVTLGLGMLTKYTLAFYIFGLVVGVLLTPTRRHLTSRWLWAGVGLSLLVFLPNLIWQAQHNFISLQFLNSIHDRDVRIGRADGFLPMQFIVNANPFTLPLWIAGLYYFFFNSDGSRYRLLGWLYVVTLISMMIAQGRFYYVAPAYPMLLAAGTVIGERWLASFAAQWRRLALGLTWTLLAVGGVVGGGLMLPIAPIGSSWWNAVSEVHDNFVEQIGWPELVKTVADLYSAQPTAEKVRTGILVSNYGEAGAINFLGAAYGLPQVISGVNSYWARGYGDPPPETLIVVGFSQERVEELFTTCELKSQITNSYGVENEETKFHSHIFLCRGLRQPWPEFWIDFQYFN